MNWVKEAEYELKNQSNRIKATENIKIRLDALSKVSSSPEILQKQLDLYNQLEALSKLTDLCDKTLNMLSPLEKEVLLEFYVLPQKDHIDYICSQHAIEKSTVYRIKNSALKSFSTIMFGSC